VHCKWLTTSLCFAGGLNIEGKLVDSCLNNGTACGQAAADAYCQYIGFDGAVTDLFTTAPADEPTRAVSGEPIALPCLCVAFYAQLEFIRFKTCPSGNIGHTLGASCFPQ
jgi:hypothetical protein